MKVEGNIPQVMSVPMNSSGLESSMISPPGGDSIIVGTIADNLNR